MRVPDDAYFGGKPGGGEITYGEVRKMISDDDKIEILKSRTDVYLIDQVDKLSKRDENGAPIIWSPFPLSILTLISIETLGRIIGNPSKISQANDYEIPKLIARPIYKLMDIKLSHGVSKQFHKSFTELHGKEDKKSLEVYSDVIHKYQRNTFIHGFQAKGVYLNHLQKDAWIIDDSKGYMTLNPYLFWDLFKSTYEDVFAKVKSNKGREWRVNALQYLDGLLN